MESRDLENLSAARSEGRGSRGACSLAVLVLTMGDRPGELVRMAASLATQQADEKVLVANGADLTNGLLIDGLAWRVVATSENLGVPGGRSHGIANTTSDVIVFLDDDCAVVSPDLLERIAARFDEQPRLGALALHLQINGSDRSMRRWIPTSRSRDDTGIRPAVTFPGNGHALRRTAYEDVGGYCDELFFKHEETQLSWALLDGGWQVAYDDSLIVEHPETPEARHDVSFRLGVRNKVWLARMFLPAALVLPAMAITVIRYLARCRRVRDLTHVWSGLMLGLRRLPRTRKPMKWATVAQLTRRGRPAIL